MRRALRIINIVLLLLAALAAQQIPLNPKLYDPQADAKAEIAKALKEAGERHRRVLLVFGANWCPDCHVLDYQFHQQPASSLIADNFIVVHVDIGEGEGKYAKNTDLAAKYRIPLKKGVPAVAVLSENGQLLYSQQNGEFEAARRLDPQEIVRFLEQWKPPKRI
jgi:thiol:disulfide interchange protein